MQGDPNCAACRTSIAYGDGPCFDHSKATPEAEQPAGFTDPHKCGYCRRRGALCTKHGGSPTQGYQARMRRGDVNGDLDKPLPPSPTEFSDPYRCSMCSRKGSLCDMHERFQRDQANKPKLVPAPAPIQPPAAPPAPIPEATTVKTTEQTIGSNRIVQIKVGDVIITIKEPIS